MDFGGEPLAAARDEFFRSRHWLALGLLLALPAAGAPRFREVASSWGLDFRHHHGASGQFYMIETMGSGLVAFDYDNDGDADLFWIDSGSRRGHEGEARSRLFRNDGVSAGGRVRFVDVSLGSGLEVTSYGMGGAAGDIDADGDLDLYVTAFGANQMFENRGDGNFREVTTASGTGDPLWSSSAAFADFDQDGDLDLYVANYVDFAYDKNPICGFEARGLRSYCHPNVYQGLPDRYYRNRGNGTFEDATAAAGFGGLGGNGLGVCAGDLDGDFDLDLFVANDMTPNFQFENRGDGVFEEIGLLAGTALSDTGKAEAGMGIELADLDGDGRADLFVTHLDLETNAAYFGQGPGLFRDGRFVSGLAEPSLTKVAFGVAGRDFDLDGDLDLVVANGHIIHNAELWGTGTSYKQVNQLFENLGGGRFREVMDSGLTVVRSSRGLATADLDLDGDLEVAISNSDDLAEVYENISPAGFWLALEPRSGAAGVVAVGVGAELVAGGLRTVGEARTGCSYQSQSELAMHFGLGRADHADRLALRLPSGQRVTFLNLPANRRYQDLLGSTGR